MLSQEDATCHNDVSQANGSQVRKAPLESQACWVRNKYQLATETHHDMQHQRKVQGQADTASVQQIYRRTTEARHQRHFVQCTYSTAILPSLDATGKSTVGRLDTYRAVSG